MKRYYKIWFILATNSVQSSLSSRLNASVLIAGKLLRFGMFFFFLVILASRTKLIAGYSLEQIIFFYLTYQLIDTLPQMFMREVYKFRRYVVSGDFDYFLVKPFSPLFRALLGGPDILDVPMTIISLIAILYTAFQIQHIFFFNILAYFLLVCNALLITLSFHILVVSMGIVTTEVDNAIMLYRDITQMGRLPVDIYQQPLQGFITFIIPVAIMMTVPAKAMFGLLSFPFILVPFIISFLFFSISILAWKSSLKRYSSASS